MSQVVPLRQKTRKSKQSQTPPKPPVNYKKVKELSRQCVSDNHMRLLLGLSESDFEILQGDLAFREACELGRAEGCRDAALIVQRVMKGLLKSKVTTIKDDGSVVEEWIFSSVDRARYEAAKDYLAKHAPHWMSD